MVKRLFGGSPLQIVGKIFFCLGALLLLGAAFVGIGEMRWLAETKTASAHITEIRNESMRDVNGRYEGRGYRVVFQFVADDGKTVTVPSSVVSSSTSYRTGDTVSVNYLPGNPGGAQLDRWADRWLVPTVLFAIGLLAVVIGGVAGFGRAKPGEGWTRTYGGAMAPPVAGGAIAPPVAGPIVAPQTVAQETIAVRPAAGSGNRLLKIGAIGVAALVVIAVIVHFTQPHRVETAHAQTGTVANKGSVPPGDHGPVAPGYPSSLTVQAPPDTTPIQAQAQKPAPPAAPAAPSAAPAPSTQGQDLLALSRAYLLRPDTAKALQTALRAKAQSLPGLCPQLSFKPGELFVKTPPPPRFDAHGTLVDGSIRQRFIGEDCGSAHPVFNIWTIVKPGLPERTIAAYNGDTRADIDLQQDGTNVAVTGAATAIKDCTALSVIDTKLIGFEQSGTSVVRPWREAWLVGGCGKFARVTMHFAPDPAQQRTAITAPSAEVEILNLSGAN